MRGLLLFAALSGVALAVEQHNQAASITATTAWCGTSRSTRPSVAAQATATSPASASTSANPCALRMTAAGLHQPLERLRVRAVSNRRDSAISIRPDRNTLERGAGEWFTVSWAGVPDPKYDDWIAVVVPANASLSETAPAKWKFAAGDPGHVTSGAGSLRFRMISYRADFAFALLRNGFDSAVEVARSEPVRVSRPNEPLQVHLALTGKPSEMRVQWNTRDAGSRPQVRWGPAPVPHPHGDHTGDGGVGGQHGGGGKDGPAYPFASDATSSRYERDDMCGGTATSVGWVDAGSHHVGLMSGLQPATKYYYRVGDQWDNFMHQIQPLAARMPYMVAAGNHERDWPGSGDLFGVQDSGGECGLAFERRFPMPYPGRDKLWYAFEYGPVFVLQYSTEHPFAPGTEQYEFIVEALSRVDRRRTPWLILGGHRPIYVASTNANLPDGDQPVSEALRAALEDLLLEHAVDLTLHGHHHSYQRTCPLYRGACQPAPSEEQARRGAAAAPVHLVIGHAGAGLSLNIMEPPPEWLQAVSLWWGYLRLSVSGMELRAEVVSDEDGALVDSFTLTKPAGWGEAFMAVREAAAAEAQRLRAAKAAQAAAQEERGAGAAAAV
ncbi:hypothetical protein GPECTOR_26g580 [Gonium pectorale]|uniref:Uncharacterized protein n=1 Tax=Gonium pectorale TaxID=33097 RepID=A0A150GFP5_GONPE|nr:hypothetical protein GPECTOR_26g580 [Gonium pectorale]|eukprot:KXZ48677.1 hypothetical protein GPECTOR_26g580 [Gonium pectorale]